MDQQKISYEGGWYPEEQDGARSFRWMKKDAVCRIGASPAKGGRYLLITARHLFDKQPAPRLEVAAGGKIIGLKTMIPYFTNYLFPFEEDGKVEFSLRLDKEYSIPEDPRKLGIQVRNLTVLAAEDITETVYGDGWYEQEHDDFVSFRWLSRQGLLLVPPERLFGFKYMTLPVFSEFMDFSQTLTVERSGKRSAEWPLLNKWNYYSIPLQTKKMDEGRETRKTEAFELVLAVNKVFPARYHHEDKRELGIRVGEPEFHNDDQAHESFLFLHRNALLNYREMIQGRTKLESFPLNLGIDIYGKCNINPPCVYCLWDKMKILEGDNVDAVVDMKTLEGYGRFFRSPRTLVSCSFGEPLLHPQLGEILDSFARHRKILEISTNGQAFTERTIRALVGKPVYLYISLDAATKETYAKIRNDRWETVIPSLKRLNEERKKAGNLPKIYMVFMPMRVNRGDLENYFRLCRDINADFLVLRQLLHLWKPRIESDRGGYHFDYENEMLSREEYKEIIALSEKYSKAYGVRLANQFNFGEFPDAGSAQFNDERGGHEQ